MSSSIENRKMNDEIATENRGMPRILKPPLRCLVLFVAAMLPSLAFSAMQWTYRLNAFNVGGGFDVANDPGRRVCADATGDLLSVAIGANANSDWGIAVGATLLRVSYLRGLGLTGGALLVGPCVTHGVGSIENRAIPVYSLSAQVSAAGSLVGSQAVLAELRAEWAIGIIRPGVRVGVAAYSSDGDNTVLAPSVGVYVGLGGWGAFTRRGGEGWGS